MKEKREAKRCKTDTGNIPSWKWHSIFGRLTSDLFYTMKIFPKLSEKQQQQHTWFLYLSKVDTVII